MSGTDEHGELIIIKRHEDEEHEAHSSAWKVAHADFMTAMMAFFLIMWLINVTDKDTRKAIANYFNPVDLASSITDVRGLNDPDDTVARGTSQDGDKQSTLKNTVGKGTGSGADRQQGDKERAAFQDPYAVLDKLAGDAQPRPGGTPDHTVGDVGSPGTGAGDMTRDPFDPAYWQMTGGAVARTDNARPSRIASPGGGQPNAAGARRREAGKAQPPAPAPQSSEDAGVPPAKAQSAQQLEGEIKAAMAADMGSAHAPKVDVRATKDGMIIDLTDNAAFSMFPVGSAIPDGKLVRAIAEIAKLLAARPGDVTIRGHTDGRPFRSETYDNWRLSSARAHMALYMLVRGGLDENRVVKIEGVADRDLKVPDNPEAPQNRRIEILLRAPTQ